jgi:hypothetical protein
MRRSFILTLLALAACAGSPTTDAGQPLDAGAADAGTSTDAGLTSDAGTSADAGPAGRYWDGGTCAVKTDCPCFSSDDCGPGFTCHSEDSTGTHVYCEPGSRGTGAAGAPCSTEADCQSALCVDGTSGTRCSVLCSTPNDCPASLPRCTYVGFGVERSLCSP